MKLNKSAEATGAVVLDSSELEQINRQAKKHLTPEEVYAFSVKLCDNEVDRDFERFPMKSLEALAILFVGKSGVFDHDWSAKAQCARIYRTEVVREQQRNSLGEPYAYVKGYAYMLRNEKHAELIEEIEGGIKKEVSVSCAAGRKLCSVCGGDLHTCRHETGKTYEDKLCYGDLVGISDAYEWSFVAVPAQPMAGVLKRAEQEEKGLKLQELAEKQPQLTKELEQLQKEAALGRRYLKELRSEVARLGGLALPELGMDAMGRVTQNLGEEELLEMKKAYESQIGWLQGLKPQLPGSGGGTNAGKNDAAYRI